MSMKAKNLVNGYIKSANNLLDVKRSKKKQKNKKHFFKKFIKFIMNSISNCSFKNMKFTESALDTVLESVNIPFNSSNYILNDVIKIIDEAVKSNMKDDEFIDKIKNIDNLDSFIDDTKERIVTQISDSINSNKVYKEKIETSVKDIENKIVNGEVNESALVSMKNNASLKISENHKYTLLNIITQKMGEISIKESNEYQDEGCLDVNLITEHGTILYSILETLNSLDLIGNNFIKNNIIK